MLRLWPKRLIFNIFPESGWLRLAGGREICRFTLDGTETVDVLQGIELLLESASSIKPASVEVIVSDEFSRILHLPWQDTLTSDAQREMYARAYFDQAGLRLDSEWLVHAGYRHFNGGGIAYALPRLLVSSVKDHLSARGMRLRSIMPLSARAYWRNSPARQRTRSLLFLEERRRVSALIFEDSKCSGIFVQPGLSDQLSAQRLIRTVDTIFPNVRRVQVWNLLEERVDKTLIQAFLPKATVEHVSKTQWD